MPDPIKPTAADDIRQNDAVWARFYRDGKNLGEIAEEFGGSTYTYSPWLYAPLMRPNDTAAQQAREQALEEAAVAMENLCFFTDIEELREMTKQDLSVRTCHKGAEAIRALKEKRPC